MKPSAWPTALAATLAGLILVPAAALGAPPERIQPLERIQPPERIQVCHSTADAVPDGHRWNLVEVSVKSLDSHLAHGDGIPGGEVPGNGAAFFNEHCAPQLPEPLPDEPLPDEPLPDEPLPDEPLPDEPLPDEPLPDEPLPDEPLPDEPLPDEPLPDEPLPDESSELVFAVAYSDTDGGDGGYNPAEDVLIAKLIDGPDSAADGLPGAGDLIVTYQYPKDFGPSDFGKFGVTEHTVTELEGGMLGVCNVSTADGRFVWSNSGGLMDGYWEFDSAMDLQLQLVDDKDRAQDDMIAVSTSSPSQPSEAVEEMTAWDSSDASFIDVEADCTVGE